MHLSDFMDYNLPELEDQMPRAGSGTYVPQALNTSLEKKLELFSEMIELIASEYQFLTLKQWYEKVKSNK